MSLFESPAYRRATVIIPTFGDAPFVRCAIESAQAQTVRDIEICVILDGSPLAMRDLIDGLAVKDERIRVFEFPKAPRTGEIHRARILPQTKGRIICYLSHDDLWFPNHVEIMEQELADADFAHSLHVDMGLGETFGVAIETLLCDLSHPEIRRRMLDRDVLKNYFGLSCGAHTREAYSRLPEGWTVTPAGTPTDLYMWRKFLTEHSLRAVSVMLLSVLHFPAPVWTTKFSVQEFERELDRYLSRSREPEFQKLMFRRALHEAITRKINQEISLAESLKDQEIHRTEMMQALMKREQQLATLIEAEAGRRVRELPARKIWKLMWKRLTHQYQA